MTTQECVYIMEVTVLCYGDPAQYPSRVIAILPTSSLYTLARTILQAFNFDSDHLFGFYDNVHWTHSEKVYEFSFEDDSQVKKTKIENVFNEIGKKMLFLYDYGDEWHFIVEFIQKGPRKIKKKYPLIVERKGKAPSQYEHPPYFGEEEYTDPGQKKLTDYIKENTKEYKQKNLDER